MILLAFAIAMFNQLSGINAILYYAPEVMKQAGAAGDAALLMSVGVGLMNLIATMAALTVIDKFGRRKLMIVGSIGYIISLGFLAGVMFAYAGHFNATSAYLVLAGLLVFIAAHAFGQGVGDLGVHLRDLPQPHPRPWPVAGQPDPLGVRRAHFLRLPAGDRGAGRRRRPSASSRSAWWAS